ncbi:hypothetical protein [Paenibacillus polymyxa]|uniref:hypothetical protein n=1 Tax=Paenibacillus polymyxa TaxID=1406 RepID=UPI0023F6DEDF|nr:hypothetical protein [Paenibacillus polymyxa]
MKYRTINIAVAIIFVLAWGIYGTYYFLNLNTSIQKAVLDQVDMDNVYLQIIRTHTKITNEPVDYNVHVMENTGVKAILDQLAGIELKKTNGMNNGDKVPFYYTIIIRPKSNQDSTSKYEITFKNNKSVSIFDQEKNYRKEYMITNEFDYHLFKNSIDKLFQRE